VAALPPAVRRLCLVVDVEHYSRYGNPQAVEVQKRLLWSMWHACKAAGVDPRRCEQQDRGDGQLILLPPAIDEAFAVPRLLLATRAALYRVNRRPEDVGRMRLRAAMAQSPVHKAATGYVGAAVMDACRLLDSQPLRRALAKNHETDVAAFVTDDIYRHVIAHGYGDLDPGAFKKVEVGVPEKEFSASAYLYLPRGAVDRKLVPRFTGVPAPNAGGPGNHSIWTALTMTAGGSLLSVGLDHLLEHVESGDDHPDGGQPYGSEAPFTVVPTAADDEPYTGGIHIDHVDHLELTGDLDDLDHLDHLDSDDLGGLGDDHDHLDDGNWV
jgi:hypothetical protein